MDNKHTYISLKISTSNLQQAKESAPNIEIRKWTKYQQQGMYNDEQKLELAHKTRP